MSMTMKALPVTMLLVVFLSKYLAATSHHGSMSCFKYLFLVVVLLLYKYSVATNDCTTDLPEGFQIPVVPTDDDKWKPSNCE